MAGQEGLSWTHLHTQVEESITKRVAKVVTHTFKKSKRSRRLLDEMLLNQHGQVFHHRHAKRRAVFGVLSIELNSRDYHRSLFTIFTNRKKLALGGEA